MKNLIIAILGFLTLTPIAYGAFSDPFVSIQLGTDPTNGECLTTDGTNNTWGTCGGANPNSKWATSTGSTIIPNGSGGIIVSASSTLLELIFNRATGTSATTTSFAVTSIASSLLKTNANGSIVPAILGTDYIDRAEQNYKESAEYATTAALPTVVYDNGSSGVGATLTAVAVGAISIDGSSPSVGDRILVKNQVSTAHNGIYTVTVAGSGIAVFVLTRATDFDQAADILSGDAVFVSGGSTLSATTWAYTGIDSPTMGTSAITFVQIAGQGSFTAGNGISISGTTISQDFTYSGTYTGNNIFNSITRSTTTQATTTNLFSTTASSTNLLATKATTTSLFSTQLWGANLGFAYATSTWSGTTTLRIGPAPVALTIMYAYCETDTGTVGVSLYDGTNRALYMPTASTTINRFDFTASNNSFTAGESIRVDIGTPASSPRYISCRFANTFD